MMSWYPNEASSGRYEKTQNLQHTDEVKLMLILDLCCETRKALDFAAVFPTKIPTS
jgi:hypothetical protein